MIHNALYCVSVFCSLCVTLLYRLMYDSYIPSKENLYFQCSLVLRFLLNNPY